MRTSWIIFFRSFVSGSRRYKISIFGLPKKSKPGMTRLIIILLLFSNFFIYGCTEPDSKRHYKNVGKVGFRRSYGEHESWSEAELDSVEKSNPFYMDNSDSSAGKVLTILNRLGIGNKDELFLDKIARDLKDTTTIVNHSADIDTIYISYDMAHTKASIQIRNARTIDSIPIEEVPFSHTFSLVRFKIKSNPFIVFVNQYYIMNGDNYEVSVYEKK
jgi:hypothetical protein